MRARYTHFVMTPGVKWVVSHAAAMGGVVDSEADMKSGVDPEHKQRV